MNLEQLKASREHIPPMVFKTKYPKSNKNNERLNEKRHNAEMRSVEDSFKLEKYYDFED